MFGSTSSARVAPAAPPTRLDEDEDERGEPSQRELDAGRDREAPEGMPPEIHDLLRSLGIEIPHGSNVHVATQTTQLTGINALTFLGQLGGFLARGALGNVGVAAGKPATSIQVHPGIQIVADGVAQASPDRLRSSGVDAQAKILDFEAEELTVGDSHVAKLRLEVTRPGAEPYEVTTGALVPTRVTEEFAEGKTFPAKVDPVDRRQVLVEWGEPRPRR